MPGWTKITTKTADGASSTCPNSSLPHSAETGTGVGDRGHRALHRGGKGRVASPDKGRESRVPGSSAACGGLQKAKPQLKEAWVQIPASVPSRWSRGSAKGCALRGAGTDQWVARRPCPGPPSGRAAESHQHTRRSPGDRPGPWPRFLASAPVQPTGLLLLKDTWRFLRSPQGPRPPPPPASALS